MVLLIVLTVLYRRSQPETAATPTVPASDVAAANGSEAGAFQRGRAGSATDPVAIKKAIQASRERGAKKREEVQQKVDRTHSAFAAKFGKEGVDAAWAGAKESTLARKGVSSQISQMGVAPKDMKVDCKTTMCLITGDFPNMTAGDDWVTLYMNNVASDVPMASYKYVQNGDGTVTINVYAMGRK